MTDLAGRAGITTGEPFIYPFYEAKSAAALVPGSILLIAYGNNLRSDDGAGLMLAERLEQIWQAAGVPVRYLPVQQLTPELAAEMAHNEISTVIFVDTRDAAGEEEEQPAVQLKAISGGPASPSLGHQLDPSALLTYTRLLYNKEPAAWLLTTPGVDFSLGERLSPVASTALAEAWDYLAVLLSLV
jgi:hydrogenase maturation protease